MSLRSLKRKSIEFYSRLFPDTMETSEGKTLNVFRKDAKKNMYFNPRFLKAFNAGLFELTDANGDFVRQRISDVVTNKAKSVNNVLTRHANNQQIKSKGGGRDKSYPVEFIFKSWMRYDKKKKKHKFYYWKAKYNLSSVVYRKLKDFKTSISGSTIKYDFLTEYDENKEPVVDYSKLEALTGSLLPKESRADGNHKVRELNKSKYFHTSETLREEFESWINDIDDILSGKTSNGASHYVLVEIDINVTSQGRDVDTRTVASPSQIVQANKQAMFFTSFLVKNDIEKQYDDGINPESFKKRTGLEYRENSCLATIVLWFMYHKDNSRYPKYIEGSKKDHCGLLKSRRDVLDKYGVKHVTKSKSGVSFESTKSSITYELISNVTGIEFKADGALQLSFEQIEFFEPL
jgi:hypothetical protein